MRNRIITIAVFVALLGGRALAQVEDDLREGDSYFDDGDWRKAAAAFDRAISKFPTQVPAEAYGKAATQLETVEKKFGKKPNAVVNADNGLCGAYTGLRRYDQAITVCERIIQDPKKIDSNGSVWFNLGTAYLAKHQPAKARTA